MKNYTELLDYIKSVEQEHAYGSETIWWGRFLNDVYEQYPDIDPHEPDENAEIDDDFYEWWADLYMTLDNIESSDDITEEDTDRLNDCSDGDDWIKMAKKILEI